MLILPKRQKQKIDVGLAIKSIPLGSPLVQQTFKCMCRVLYLYMIKYALIYIKCSHASLVFSSVDIQSHTEHSLFFIFYFAAIVWECVAQIKIPLLIHPAYTG